MVIVILALLQGRIPPLRMLSGFPLGGKLSAALTAD